MKKSVFALSIILIVAMLASCSPAPTAAPATVAPATAAPATAAPATAAPATAAPASGTITVTLGLGSDPATLDPFAAVNLGRLTVIPTVFEGLFEMDSFGGKLVGVIAKDMVNTSGMVYRITIHDNVVDTAGNHITASDVKFSYDTAAASQNYPRSSLIDKIEIIDDYTLDFTFNTIGLSTLQDILPEFPIVSQKAYEASTDQMATDPVGTTAYALTNYTSGSSLTFEKTGKYWQTDSSMIASQSMDNPDKIIYQIIQDPAQMAIALETGSVDVATSVSTDDIGRFMDSSGKAVSGYTLAPILSNVTMALLFNCSDQSPYENKALRQATLYAIDKQAIVDGVLGGKGEADVTFGGSVYGDFLSKWKTEDYYNYNVDKAKQALTDSGVNAGSLNIRIMTNANPAAVKAAQIIQAELLDIGVNSKVDSYEEALFQSYLADPTQWDIQLNTKGSGGYLASMWQFVFDAGQYTYGTQNFVKDDKLQQLVVAVSSIAGHTPENVDAFHQYLKDQAYASGLYNAYSYAVGKSTVTSIPYYSKPFVLAGGLTFSSDFGK
jgi:ABC-type transport system substrate-binding protein